MLDGSVSDVVLLEMEELRQCYMFENRAKTLYPVPPKESRPTIDVEWDASETGNTQNELFTVVHFMIHQNLE